LKEEKLNQVSDLPCKFSDYFATIASAFLIGYPGTRKIGLSFALLLLLSSLLSRSKKKLSDQEKSKLLKIKNFKVLNLTPKEALELALKVTYDSLIRAPIDTFNLSKSLLLKITSALGLAISPIVFPLALVYSASELIFLYAFAKRRNLIILFSEEIYRETTRLTPNSGKLPGLAWCGIPGILLIKEEPYDIKN